MPHSFVRSWPPLDNLQLLSWCHRVRVEPCSPKGCIECYAKAYAARGANIDSTFLLKLNRAAEAVANIAATAATSLLPFT